LNKPRLTLLDQSILEHLKKIAVHSSEIATQTDNGSEFKKHFDEKLHKLHIIYYYTHPKTPNMNAHLERFNRTIQEDFIDWHLDLLAIDINVFN